MHIKELEIQGFKSYKEQAGVDAFSAGHNTIVGRNGSGKSNFFRAIQFVLGEKAFSNLSHKERTELLHEGAGASVMTAHVQIVFDNSERRFPLDSDDVVLRRTIGLKKDEYFLNSKHVTKTDVVNLLESAGFSRSNPYYIVQQGKVNALCLMKDEQRLDLLKEVAGTTVYEERRRNSEAILAETKKKREKIQDVVRYIEERLDELKDEKEELEAFRSLDRRKRALEYSLYDLELQGSTRALETLEEDREAEVAATAEASQALLDVREQTETLENELKAAEALLRRSEHELQLTDAEVARLVKARAASELKARDMQERESALREQERLHHDELARLEEQVAAMQARLEQELRPAAELAGSACEAEAQELRALERRRRELESKQGRSSQFATQDERDAWLKGEMESVDKALAGKRQSLAELEAQQAQQQEAREALAAAARELREALATREALVEDTEAQLRRLRQQRDQAAEERKAQWRKQQELEREVQAATGDLRRAEKQLRRSIPPAVAQGLEAVDRIAKDLGLGPDQVFGPLYELVTPESEAVETAIEVAAGNSLTHVVVDDDATAAKLMKELQRRKAGRVTFKPLAQIATLRRQHHQRQQQHRQRQQQDQQEEDPGHDIVGFRESGTEDSADALPLIRKVSYPSAVGDAVRLVLGRVLLCRNGQVAAAMRREHRVSCVTLEGEEVNARGALTGGFHDARSSKLRAAAGIRAAKAQLRQLQARQEEAEAVRVEREQQVTQLVGRVSKLEADQAHAKSLRGDLARDAQHKEQQVGRADPALEELQTAIATCRRGLQELGEQREAYAAELATPMLDKLTPAEQREFAEIKRGLLEKRRAHAKSAEELAKAKAALGEVETELNENLVVRRAELLKAMGKGPKAKRSKRRSAVLLDDDEEEDEEEDEDGDKEMTDVQAASKKRKAKKAVQVGAAVLEDDDDDEEEDDEEVAAAAARQGKLEWVVSKVKETKEQLAKVTQRLEEAQAMHREMEKEATRTRSRVEELHGRQAELKRQELDLTEKLQQSEEVLDKLLTKRSMQLEKREVSARKIRELGSLSSEELDKVGVHKSAKSLMGEIKKANDALRKYSHVNKKALDQFVSFSDRRETLLKRKEELDSGEQSILELIRDLDHQKDEDILRTFRGVAKNFREVFQELVPQGKGELIMVTSDSTKPRDPATSSDSMEPVVDEFVGISPRVSFTGRGDQFRMRQLSGGQRALVALTLIFAIQRCDPAPFYLFDEIDQALDQNHRASVAAMIQRQAETAQFITTTFRPELVHVSDKCFGIQFQNKVSSMIELPAADAVKFVETIAASEGGVAPQAQGGRTKRKPLSDDMESDEEESDEEEGGEESAADSGSEASNPAAQRRSGRTRRTSASGKRVRAGGAAAAPP